jgi:hypothetical protein
MKTVSNRKCNSNVAGAKRTAATEPLFITDRGEPACVLLSIELVAFNYWRHRCHGRACSCQPHRASDGVAAAARGERLSNVL